MTDAERFQKAMQAILSVPPEGPRITTAAPRPPTRPPRNSRKTSKPGATEINATHSPTLSRPLYRPLDVPLGIRDDFHEGIDGKMMVGKPAAAPRAGGQEA